MPGRPSTTSEIESPTGCTKQLMSVACIWMPAAELMRPAGMKPASSVSANLRSHWARFSGVSTAARARATRARTSATVRSLPFAYFSSRASRQISCSGSDSATVFALSMDEDRLERVGRDQARGRHRQAGPRNEAEEPEPPERLLGLRATLQQRREGLQLADSYPGGREVSVVDQLGAELP